MSRKAYGTSYNSVLTELLKQCKDLCRDRREREKQHKANFSKSEARARNDAVQAPSVLNAAFCLSRTTIPALYGFGSA